MAKETEVKSGWYEIFKEGIEEIGIKSILNIMKKIEITEDFETQEQVDEINQLISDLELTVDEEMAIFDKFHSSVKTFKSSSEAKKFVEGKLNRKSRLLANRISRAIPEDFGAYLLHLRDAKGYSLKDVERITGISPSYINRIEKGERKAPSYPIMEKLAHAYKIPVQELLKSAGVKFETIKNTQGFSQVIYSNNFTINGIIVSTKQKEVIVELIEKMDSAKWDETTKHIDTVEFINIINRYKNLKE